MNGLDLIRRVYQRLRKPSQQALPFQVALETVAEVIARKKLDLALSEQNSLATMSQWFTPSQTDFPLENVGLSGILLPVRVETRAIDSDWETGDNVPIVNFEVLDTSNVGAISFYGDPLRIAFRDNLDYVQEQQYRVVYEADFEDQVTLVSIVGLPAYFAAMVILESAWELLEVIEDESPEWQNFVKLVAGRWESQIENNRTQWKDYVRKFKGKAQVPKRDFWQNRACRTRTRYFRG